MNDKKSSVKRYIHRVFAFSFALFTVCSPASPLTLDEQRSRYQDAELALKRQDLKTYDYLVSELQNYPLFPYLDYQHILTKIGQYDVKTMRQFEAKYAKYPFIYRLHSSYFDTLIENKAWEDVLSFQKQVPRSEKQQCHFYYAHSQVGNKSKAFKGGKTLFLSGGYVNNACDPLFEELKKANQITDELLLDRMLLAFETRNKRLMSYLNDQLKKDGKIQAKHILTLYDDPAGVGEFAKKRKVTAFYKKLSVLALKHLLRTSRHEAIKQFLPTVEGQHLTAKEKQQLADYFSSRLMSSGDKELIIWRDQWLKTTQNASLLERRFRLALTENDWNQMEFWLSRLPKKAKEDIKWQYWAARIAQQKGDQDKANKIYKQLLGQRHFYSVVSAIHLDEPISIPFQKTKLNEEKLTPLLPALTRVSEFLALSDIPQAKREWQHLLNISSQEEKSMLAAYASQREWHHLSVQATISGKLWEHLEFRFPLAYRWWFEFFSRERQLSLTTLLALSRQESAFYTNAQSPVGARGLMQLMPATAKETSKKLGLRFLGNETLKDPAVNIGLGSGYLRMLLDDYQQNRILAFAAYNAGPHRVKTWLERSKGNLDAIGFIEAIPFYETRGYVQNVLMYEIYYRKLLGMPLELLQKEELTRAY